MSETGFEYPRVGTDVWIRRDGKVLLGLRTWEHTDWNWCLPGGKMEMFEEFEEAALREIDEETGVSISKPTLIVALNSFYKERQKHYVSFFFAADWVSGEAQLKEPDKFAEWRWFEWNDLPKPLLRSTQNFVDKGYNPFQV